MVLAEGETSAGPAVFAIPAREEEEVVEIAGTFVHRRCESLQVLRCFTVKPKSEFHFLTWRRSWRLASTAGAKCCSVMLGLMHSQKRYCTCLDEKEVVELPTPSCIVGGLF